MTSTLAYRLRSLAKALFQNRRGNVAVITALSMPVLVAFVGMVAEYGHGLMLKSENQRAADLAAYSAALAYSSTESTTAMQSAASSSATLNGLTTSQVTATLVNSPSGDGNSAVMVTVSTVQPLYLTQIISRTPSFTVQASAYAEIKGGAACIMALNQGGTGVTLSGGTAIKAPGCAVASNYTVSVPCGDTITTINVTYDSASAPSQPCGGIVAPAGGSLSISKALSNDPFAGNTAVTATSSELSAVSNLTSPTVTAPTGQDLNLGWSPNKVSWPTGCSGTLSNSTWTVTCSGSRTYNIGTLTLAGGLTLLFNVSDTSNPTYNFSGSIQNGGSAMTFGSGTFNIAQGISNGGGATITFGAGSFSIGPMTTSCNGVGKFSICNPSILTFGGPSTFVIAAGVYNEGGAVLTLGSGSTNSFQIGSGSTGYAIDAAGGSHTTLADATGGSDLFNVVGNITSAGGSCLTLSAAANHQIDGSLSASGGVILGSGVYTVTGYVALGASNGGDVTCNGQDVGMDGNGVSFIIGANTTISGTGTCAGQAFCLAAGYSNVTLTAPTSGSTADFLVIGPTSASNKAGATFTEGASGTSLSGIFYLPNGPVSLSGGASVGNGSGQCLELIGSQVTLSGGTTLASTCTGVNQTAISTVELVQ